MSRGGHIQLPPDYGEANAPKAITDLVFTLLSAYWLHEKKGVQIHLGALAAKMRNHSTATVRAALLALEYSGWLEVQRVTRFSFRFRWGAFSLDRFCEAVETYREKKRGQPRGVALCSAPTNAAQCDDGAPTSSRARSGEDASDRWLPESAPNGEPNGAPFGAPNLTQASEIAPVSPARVDPFVDLSVDRSISTPSLPALDPCKSAEQEGREGRQEKDRSADEGEQHRTDASAPALRELEDTGQTLAAAPSSKPAADTELANELRASVELSELAKLAAEKFRSDRSPHIALSYALRKLSILVTEFGWSTEQIERWIHRASGDRGEYVGLYRGTNYPIGAAVDRLRKIEAAKRARQAKARERQAEPAAEPAPSPAVQRTPAAQTAAFLATITLKSLLRGAAPSPAVAATRTPEDARTSPSSATAAPAASSATQRQREALVAPLGAFGPGGAGWDETNPPQPGRSGPRTFERVGAVLSRRIPQSESTLDSAARQGGLGSDERKELVWQRASLHQRELEARAGDARRRLLAWESESKAEIAAAPTSAKESESSERESTAA